MGNSLSFGSLLVINFITAPNSTQMEELSRKRTLGLHRSLFIRFHAGLYNCMTYRYIWLRQRVEIILLRRTTACEDFVGMTAAITQARLDSIKS